MYSTYIHTYIQSYMYVYVHVQYIPTLFHTLPYIHLQVTLPHKDLATHLALFCNDRLIFCSLGCGEKLKQVHINRHIHTYIHTFNILNISQSKSPVRCNAAVNNYRSSWRTTHYFFARTRTLATRLWWAALTDVEKRCPKRRSTELIHTYIHFHKY